MRDGLAKSRSRIKNLATAALLLFVSVGCGGQSGGFPSGLGDGLVDDQERTMYFHVRWRTDPADGKALAVDLPATNGSDTAAKVIDDQVLRVDSGKQGRIRAPLSAAGRYQDAWVTLQGAGINGSNVSFFVSSDPNYRTGQSIPGISVNDSGAQITGTNAVAFGTATDAGDLRNMTFKYVNKVFRGGDVTVIVEFYDHDANNPVKYSERLTPSGRNRFRGASTFVSKFPESTGFNLLGKNQIDSGQDLTPQDGRIAQVSLSLTGVPGAIAQSVSIIGSEDLAGSEPKFFVAKPIADANQPITLLVVDRRKPLSFRARAHTGPDASGVTLKESDVTSIPINQDATTGTLALKDTSIVIVKLSGESPVTLENNTLGVTYEIGEKRLRAGGGFEVDPTKPVVAIPKPELYFGVSSTVEAVAAFAKVSGQTDVSKVDLKRAGTTTLKFPFTAANLSPEKAPDRVVDIESQYKTFAYAGDLSTNPTADPVEFFVQPGSVLDIKLALQKQVKEDDPRVPALATDANSDGVWVLTPASAYNSYLTLTGLRVNANTVTPVGGVEVKLQYRGKEFSSVKTLRLKFKIDTSAKALGIAGLATNANFGIRRSANTTTDDVIGRTMTFQLEGGGKEEPLSREQYSKLEFLGFTDASNTSPTRSIPSYIGIVPAGSGNGLEVSGNAATGVVFGPFKIVARSYFAPASLKMHFRYVSSEFPTTTVIVPLSYESIGQPIALGLDSSQQDTFVLKKFESAAGDGDSRVRTLSFVFVDDLGVVNPLTAAGTFKIVSLKRGANSGLPYVKLVGTSVGQTFTKANFPRLRGISSTRGDTGDDVVLTLDYTGPEISGVRRITVPIRVFAGTGDIGIG